MVRARRRSTPTGRTTSVARMVGVKSGQALVEFALLLPIVLLLGIGVVDGARVFTAWISVTGAAREAVLYASTDPKFEHWCMNPGTAPAGSISCPGGAQSGISDGCADGAASTP